MCGYCENDEQGKTAIRYDFDGNTFTQIRLGRTLGYPAIVSVYGRWSCDCYGINYCPMCGRELMGDVE